MPATPLRKLAPLLPIALAQIVGVACGVVGVKLMSLLVPPALYGVYGVFISLTPIGMWVVYSGLIKHVGRHWMIVPDRDVYVGRIIRGFRQRLPLLVVATLAAGLLIFGPFDWRLLPALLLANLLLVPVGLTQSALQTARQNWRDCTVSAIGSVTRSLVPPLLVVIGGASIGMLTGGFCIHAACLAAAGLWFFRRHLSSTSPRADQPRADSLEVYQGPVFLVPAMLGWALSGMNRWLVIWFHHPTQAGYFVLAGNLALIIPNVANAILLQYFTPRLYARADAEGRSGRELLAGVDRFAAIFVFVSVAGLLILRTIAPLLIGPLINASYEGSLRFLLGAGLFGVSTGTSHFYYALLLAERRESANLTVGVAAFAALALGSGLTAASSLDTFVSWLCLSPLVPWVIVRPLVKRHILAPARPI